MSFFYIEKNMGVNVSKSKPAIHAYPTQRKVRGSTQSNIELVRSLHQSLEKRPDVRRPSGKSNKFFQANKRSGRRVAITHESPLTREYNAWLRSLANNIDEDETPRKTKETRRSSSLHKESGSWYSTLRHKVNSLMKSKRHRENAIVWPETSRDSLQHSNVVTPKVRLSFAPDKQYVKELRKQIIDSHKRTWKQRRSVADFSPKNDEFDPAAFYMEQSFQCTDANEYVRRKTSKSIESIQSAIASERLKRHSIRTDSHRSSSSGRGSKQKSPSKEEVKLNKYQWDVAYDPYGGIQGTSCVMGPKVLPTSNETWKSIATSSSNLSKSSKSSTEMLDEDTDFIDNAYSSFYGNDFQPKVKKVIRPKKETTRLRDTKPLKQDFVMFPTPQSKKSCTSENTYPIIFQHDDYDSKEPENKQVEEDEVKSKWELNNYGSANMYQGINLGPGGENFMFGGNNENALDIFTDEGIGVKGSFSSNELTVPSSGTFPRSKAAPSPQLLWKTDTNMASSLKSIKHIPSPYHRMASDHCTELQTVSGNLRSFSSQDDFYNVWDDDFIQSPGTARRSKISDCHSDYDTTRRSASKKIKHTRDRYYSKSGRRREVTQQSPLPISLSRTSSTMDEMLEDKIDSMVRSLFRDNQIQAQSKISNKSHRNRNSPGSASGSGEAAQAYYREMIESKLASALTSALVPNHPSNRNLYK